MSVFSLNYAPAVGSRRRDPKQLSTFLLTLVRAFASIVVFFAAWEISPRIGLVSPAFMPPLSVVLTDGWGTVTSGALLEHATASLTRSLAGLFIAIVIGISAGLILGWYREAFHWINPLLEMFRNTSTLALLPVFTLLLGIGEASKITIVAFACVWPIFLNTVNAIRTVDPFLIKAAQSMGLAPLRIFQKVILPASVPIIFTGVRLAAAVSILVLIAAEMVGAKSGLGFMITAAQYNFQIPEMYFGIIVISIIGLLQNNALVYIEGRLSAWKRD